MRRKVQLLVVCCLLVTLQATPALAQMLPTWMLVKAEHVFPPTTQLTSAASADAQESLESARKQARARRLLGVSAGLLAAAALHIAWAAPVTDCGSDSNPYGDSLKVATALGALGLAGTVSSAMWLRSEAKEHGRHTSKRRQIGSAGLGVLAALLVQPALIVPWVAEINKCS